MPLGQDHTSYDYRQREKYHQSDFSKWDAGIFTKKFQKRGFLRQDKAKEKKSS